MLKAFDRYYQVPCCQTIKNEIMNRYDSIREQILEKLTKTKKLSITCDIWNLVIMQSYLRITIHFIDKE